MIPVTLHEIPYFSCDVAPVAQVLSASDMAQSAARLKDGKHLVRCLTRREVFVSKPVVVIPGKACVLDIMSINWENRAWNFLDSEVRKYAARIDSKGQCPVVDYREKFYPGQHWTEIYPDTTLEASMEIKNLAELSGIALLRKAGLPWDKYDRNPDDSAKLHVAAVHEVKAEQCLDVWDRLWPFNKPAQCFHASMVRGFGYVEWMAFARYQDGSIRFKRTGYIIV
ncbi:hypothetical protein UNDYM_3969 [Undibacterium sp. YM2]|uniref:hypothetical protein n=1 Tax=Undibacterium sp. YM2 TaxID=2058625 RepID=UPI001331D382|nr:hypothetical protein [Undibacterium sp. YM2]BBB68222.1 hypothetical protein UNDYM_3969 [Undibacterium sp. YM2]